MENKIVEATNLRPESDHIIDASLVNIDLPSIIKQIKNEKAWAESDRNAITVFKTNGLSIVLVALHKNATMVEHKVDGLMNIYMIGGEIKFNSGDETIHLKTGQMLALHSRINHSIMAIEDTVFILSITTFTKQFTD